MNRAWLWPLWPSALRPGALKGLSHCAHCALEACFRSTWRPCGLLGDTPVAL
ncbi:hypothetical protein PF006_g24368 [Phytophthora fragariae]|uniref:Uncharacterized protein n=1 Tax=Phytophthora fragariae TaxID=53985 RepID=A0A6A3RB28_9STRA|nr:hypothetical protein PF006_g24368 [Phytophthora fragariae]